MHRDVLREIAAAVGLQELVDVSVRKLVGAQLHVPHGFRPEPVGADGAQYAVLGVIDMHERLELDPHGRLFVHFGLLLEIHQQRARFVDQSALSRSTAMMSSCLVTAQNGR